MPESDYIFIGKIIPCGFAKGKATSPVFSLCLDINGKCGLLEPETPNYSAFYEAIMALRSFSTGAIETVELERGVPPVKQRFTGAAIIGNSDPLHYIGGGKQADWPVIRAELYQKIFACDANFKSKKIIPDDSRAQMTSVNEITNFYGEQNLPNYHSFKKFAGLKKFMSGSTPNKAPGYRAILDKIFSTAAYYKKLSQATFEKFTIRHIAVKEFLESFSAAAVTKDTNLLNAIYQAYIDGGTIDIDEIIHNFNLIAADPVLGRLFGFIIDFQLDIKKDFLPSDAFFVPIDVRTELKTGTGPADWKKNIFVPYLGADFLTGGNEKYALLPGDTSFSQASVLVARKDGKEIITLNSYDKTKAEENLASDNISVAIDGFTRGIICHHKELYNLIKPVNDWPLLVYAETLSQGLRMAIGIVTGPAKGEKIKWYSLTNRHLEASYKGKLFFESGNAEGCVHVDTPMLYLDNDGNLKGAISTAVAEYAEGLVSLKSVFAKVNKLTANEQAEEQQDNLDDGGLKKAEARFAGNIGIYKFPFTELQQEADCKLLYDIPQQYLDHGGPKLRFGNNYVVALYYSFANGWALPLSPVKGTQQLSVEEYIEYRKHLYTLTYPFKQLENFKPVLLFPTKETKEDTTEQIHDITDKEAHHELVIRSEEYNGNATKTARLVLPERISLEHAFWFNLLSEPAMTDTEAYRWKRKYNCEFHTKKDYDDFIAERNPDGTSKKNKCSEGCSVWCGATAMKPFYTENFITPNHLSHPDVLGFTVKLCWQKDFSAKLITLNAVAAKATFGGQKGIRPESCRLTVVNGNQDIYVDRDGREINMAVKQGAVVYCRLQTNVDESRKAIWTGDTLESHEQGDKVDYNLPLELKIVHAVKRPLMVPVVKSLSSVSFFHQQTEHLAAWLKKPGYVQYLLAKNIIADRVSESPGKSPQSSTLARINLVAHFERLDAYKMRSFLEGVTPTGGLELWMRKEVFVDDPDQLVLDPAAPGYNIKTNHFPDKPLQSFKNPLNEFSLEYKIEFTPEILHQLKDFKKVEWLNQTDPFLAVISKLALQYNVRTTRFEEREYFLKDLSKFKGYFTARLKEEDEFALPQTRSVMANLDRESALRFKVMVLNNARPQKPAIALAITTIQETRNYPAGKTTVSVQKGNIVTIYLKRGRLSSGKDERVGIVVDATSIYNDLFKANNWITKAGSDILSDRYLNRNQFLQYGDIIIPEENTYQAEFDDELGIYHFLPQFDIKKQLWKLEVELDIRTTGGKQLHNPFINFSLLHYQPFSINYNNIPASQDINDLAKDCRLSEIDNSTWCYLLPERKLSVFFDRPDWRDTWGNISVTVNFDFESLHHFKTTNSWLIRTNFVLTIEGSFDSLSWYPINCQLDNNNNFAEWGFHHALLTNDSLNHEEDLSTLNLRFQNSSNPSYKVTDPQTGQKVETNKLLSLKESVTFTKFRLRFFEVEWFTIQTWEELLKANPAMLTDDPVDNEKLRVRYVEIIY